jgi:hypothetical protein
MAANLYNEGILAANERLDEQIKRFIQLSNPNAQNPNISVSFQKNVTIEATSIVSLRASCNKALTEIKNIPAKSPETQDIDKLLYMMGITKITKYVALLSMKITTVEANSTRTNTVSLSQQNQELKEKLQQAVKIITDLSTYEDFITAQASAQAPGAANNGGD